MSTPWANTPADVVRWLIVAGGWATDPSLNQAWPAFAAVEPTDPDNCVTVFDTTGLVDARAMVDGSLMEHVAFQVRVRGQTQRVTAARMGLIRTALAEQVYRDVVTITNPGTGPAAYHVQAVVGFGPVLNLGRDRPASERQVLTLDARAAIHPA